MVKKSNIIPVVPFSSLENFQNIIENCDQKKWKKEGYISKGDTGSVYIACDTLGSCDYVMKIQKADTSFYNEVRALVELREIEIVPTIYAAWTCKTEGFMIIEKLRACELAPELVYSQIKQGLAELLKHDWLFVDIHRGNFMCGKNGKVVLIDFGWAVKKEHLGDAQIYPYHPLSEKFKKPITWKFLKIVQNHNLDFNFHPKFRKSEIPNSFVDETEAEYKKKYREFMTT